MKNIVDKDVAGRRLLVNLETVGSGTGSLAPASDIKISGAGSNISVRPGDVLFGKLRPYLRKSLLASKPLFASGEFLCLRANTYEMDPRWLLYLTLTDPWIDWAVATSYGAKMPRTSWDQIADFPLDLPSLEDQRRVADFLDLQVGKANEIVVQKRDLLGCLNERIDVLVAELIGKSQLGSGNGPIQEVRRLLRRLQRPTANGSTVVTAFRDGQVTSRARRRVDGFTDAWTGGATYQRVEVNDVVVHGLDGFAGAIGTSEATGVCSPVYHVMKPADGGDADFYGRLLRVLAITGYLALFAVSTRERAVDFRNWGLFGHIPIPEIDARSQEDIGDQIRQLRPLRPETEASVELLQERTRSLVTAAVKGEFDVTTASGRGVA